MGQDVTLRCKTNDSVPGAAHFLRHTLLVGTSPAGHITLRNFSWSDEGVYSCRDGERRESPPSWLLMDGECLWRLVFWRRLVALGGTAADCVLRVLGCGLPPRLPPGLPERQAQLGPGLGVPGPGLQLWQPQPLT